MAHKKRSRKSRTSQGIHGSSARAPLSTGMARLLNQYEAFLLGKNVMISMTTKESNRAVVRRNAKDVWRKHEK